MRETEDKRNRRVRVTRRNNSKFWLVDTRSIRVWVLVVPLRPERAEKLEDDWWVNREQRGSKLDLLHSATADHLAFALGILFGISRHSAVCYLRFCAGNYLEFDHTRTKDKPPILRRVCVPERKRDKTRENRQYTVIIREVEIFISYKLYIHGIFRRSHERRRKPHTNRVRCGGPKLQLRPGRSGGFGLFEQGARRLLRNLRAHCFCLRNVPALLLVGAASLLFGSFSDFSNHLNLKIYEQLLYSYMFS